MFEDLTLCLKNEFFLFLLILIVSDFITGVIKAGMKGEIQSSTMKEGIIGKIYEIFLVCIGCIIDHLSGNIHLMEIITTFFIAYEGSSIIENIGEYVSIPDVLKQYFEKLKNEDNAKG